MTHVVLNLDTSTDPSREALFEGQRVWWYGGDGRAAITAEFAQPPQEPGPFCLWLHLSAWGTPAALADFIQQLHPGWVENSWAIVYSGGGATTAPVLAAAAEARGLALTAFADPFPIRRSCPAYPDWQDYVTRFAKGHYGPGYAEQQQRIAALAQALERSHPPDLGDAQALIALCPPAAQAHLRQAWESAQGDPDALSAWLDELETTLG